MRAADIVIGMGSSALRAMAFAKPLIVQGEYGFWELLTPDSAPMFLRQGWYGIGSDAGDRGASTARLEKILGGLLGDRAAWPKLGDYGRKLILERFSLDHAAAMHEELYLAARESPDRPSAPRPGRRHSALRRAAGHLQGPPEIPALARDRPGGRLQRRQHDSPAGGAW